MLCALPVASEHARICGQCMQKAPPFSRVITYGLYEGVLSEAIHQFKFHRVRRLSKPLGNLLLHLEIPRADGIIPVPLTKKDLMARGFNQSLLIANVIARHTGIALFMDFLFKTKETAPQIGLSARERLSNLRNAFEVHGNLKDLRVLLVDDVITTGATVKECSKMLLKAGAQEVIVLALARAPLL
jgi:ComF family protein